MKNLHIKAQYSDFMHILGRSVFGSAMVVDDDDENNIDENKHRIESAIYVEKFRWANICAAQRVI